MGGGDRDLYIAILVDALLLSRAKCVLVSQSGFRCGRVLLPSAQQSRPCHSVHAAHGLSHRSNTALTFSKKPLCFEHMDVCINRTTGFCKGISVA
jgi:hypothetical protein